VFCILSCSNLVRLSRLSAININLIRLNDEIERKRPYTGKEPRLVILLHDNARPHTAKMTSDALDLLG